MGTQRQTSVAGVTLPEAATQLLKRIEKEFAEPEPAYNTDADGVSLAALRRLVVLDALKSINSAIEKKIAAIRAPLEAEMLAMFEQIGTNNFNIDGRTVYVHHEWWAKSKSPENAQAAIDALKAFPETEVFVKETFNTQTLSAYFRERRVKHDEEFNKLDEDLAERGHSLTEEEIEARLETHIFPTPRIADALDFSEKITVRSRSAK